MPEKDNQSDSSSEKQQTNIRENLLKNDPANALEKMLQSKQPDAQSQCSSSESKITELLAPLIEQQKNLQPVLTALQSQTVELKSEIEQLRTEDQVITKMQNYCEKLSEQQYEREVMLPMLRCLIGIADRCRQQELRFTRTLRKYRNKENNQTVIQALQTLVEARNADRIEIENLLANYGTEPFEHHGDTFDASCQKCMHRIETDDYKQKHLIAERILPGYRREEKIIRPEYVGVYVITNPQDHNSEGATK